MYYGVEEGMECIKEGEPIHTIDLYISIHNS